MSEQMSMESFNITKMCRHIEASEAEELANMTDEEKAAMEALETRVQRRIDGDKLRVIMFGTPLYDTPPSGLLLDTLETFSKQDWKNK